MSFVNFQKGTAKVNLSFATFKRKFNPIINKLMSVILRGID